MNPVSPPASLSEGPRSKATPRTRPTASIPDLCAKTRCERPARLSGEWLPRAPTPRVLASLEVHPASLGCAPCSPSLRDRGDIEDYAEGKPWLQAPSWPG